ncbi:hypothetical protein CRUP_026723, partial [Coryphaenoides rupestris]
MFRFQVRETLGNTTRYRRSATAAPLPAGCRSHTGPGPRRPTAGRAPYTSPVEVGGAAVGCFKVPSAQPWGPPGRGSTGAALRRVFRGCLVAPLGRSGGTSPRSPDEDCTLEEEEDEAPVEEEDDIDQFNDDTFGAGAIDDDWQEEHQRLAGMDVRDVGGGVAGGGATHIGGAGEPPPASHLPPPSSLPPLHLTHASSALPPPGLDDGRGGGGDLAESLARFILGADPAIAGLGAAQSPAHPVPGAPGSALEPPPSLRPHLQHPPHQLPGTTSSSGLRPASMMSYQQQQQLCRGSVPMGQDSPLMSIIKEVGLPKQPPPLRGEEPRDLSERVPPPRSSSPVIGSPPVRAVPIGTPPKQPISLNHQ